MGCESKLRGGLFINGEKIGEIDNIELSPKDEPYDELYDTFNDVHFSGTVNLSRWSTIKLKWMIFKEIMRSAFRLWV